MNQFNKDIIAALSSDKDITLNEILRCQIEVAANQFLQNELTAVLGYEPHITVYTSGKNGGDTWNSPYIFNRKVENFDVEDLKMTLYVGQHLNFDHVISAGKLNPDDADVWEANYREAPVDGTYEDFLQWCKDNDYIDDYTTESYTVVEGNN